MSHFYCYEVLLPSGRSRIGLASIPVEKNASAQIWLEKMFDGIVVRLYRLPEWLAIIVNVLRRLVRGNITARELAGILRDLAVMTSAGIPVVDAIRSITEEQGAEASKRVARVCAQLLEDLNAGSSISDAFERQPEVFPDTVRSLAVIGDETGTMNLMLMEAAEHLDRIISMKSDVKQAMIYPAFSFLAIFGAGGFWIAYVMPKLTGLFKQMNAKLPPITVNVLAASSWLASHGWLLLLITVSLFVLGVLAWKRNAGLRRLGYAALHRMPVVKGIMASSGLAFFAEYLAILTRAGLDIISSFHILDRSLHDLYYKDRVLAIRQYVERGDRISTAMRQVGGFPAMMVRMIAVGEDSGTLDRQLSYLSREYSSRLKRTVDTLSEIIKPLVVVIAGGVFLLLIVALLLPVYDLVRQTMAGPR
ncbi:MAG: type II secretion system F family protein [Comamonadaceae bacterium]|nr:MAG: type II secretion system F family protein [Comamonadaceae bacterium]